MNPKKDYINSAVIEKIGLEVNQAIFDRNPDNLIKIISIFMRKNSLEASEPIVQMIPVKKE